MRVRYMKIEIPTHYDPKAWERSAYLHWLQAKCFKSVPDSRREDERYIIMMPLPNVTGALHMGHAMDNTMQDLLIRWHRMLGDNTLWMPGTDHAGIATQAVVEKRLFELEGLTRNDIGRKRLVDRIWNWKEEYQQRIIDQQQAMGCSCDWDRQRFTMDKVCSRAVYEAFFRLFRAGLILRGERLVNWDCQLQTAVSDDEVVYETVQGCFWYIRYPVVDPKLGEPEFVTIATTRPETLLGDTAVAVHPDPVFAFEHLIAKLQAKIEAAPSQERSGFEKELEEILGKRKKLLPLLLRLSEMARDNRQILLPILKRPIPLILDEWARPELGSGCVKITPGHDPNDYEVWKRHRADIGIVNILNPDGRLNHNAGPYAGLNCLEARKLIIENLKSCGYLEAAEEREIEVGHSDRTKTPIEPFLSKQWFVRMGDIKGGIKFGAGTEKEFQAAGLAQAAIDVVGSEYRSPSGRNLKFHPDSERYKGIYVSWLAEKRDWCISRQLWWGHQIPIWTGTLEIQSLVDNFLRLPNSEREEFFVWIIDQHENLRCPDEIALTESSPLNLLICLRSPATNRKRVTKLEKLGFVQDPDVLDTWFSSAIWPCSTLGWPDPETAEGSPGEPALGNTAGFGTCLDYYYPGSCLVTGRDIITLWVARMQILGLFLLGDVPFTDCFIHANIQDGKGERMSKSKGNGIDPVDVIETYGADAMRYVLCEMQTGIQDIRLPVQALSPYTGKLIDLAKAKHGQTVFSYIDPDNGREFDVLGTNKDLPRAKIISERFDVGRAFCTKLWNASRFVLSILNKEVPEDFRLFRFCELDIEDRWVLMRLQKTIAVVTSELKKYNLSQAIGAIREFFWNDYCDWYLELTKPRVRGEAVDPRARTVLAYCLDQILRLLHPFVPFITEVLWGLLASVHPQRGIDEEIAVEELLVIANWPEANLDWADEQVVSDMESLQGIIRSIRNWRANINCPPSQKLSAIIRTPQVDSETVNRVARGIINLGNLETLEVRGEFVRPKTAAKIVHRGMEIFLLETIDVNVERDKLMKSLAKWHAVLARLESRLENPKFIEKAPVDTINEDRHNREKALREIEMIRLSLHDLD